MKTPFQNLLFGRAKYVFSLSTCFCILLSSAPTLAQGNSPFEHTSPTLQAGLNALSFSRGTLDSELIMQIVAEKQQEVALKVVQNMFLKKMESAGGAFYSFTDNIIRGVISERDVSLVSKKLLENTVNITFTYAFADHYLRELSPSNLSDLNLLVRHEFIGLDSDIAHQNVRQGLKGFIVAGSKPNDKVCPHDTQTRVVALICDMASEAIKNNKTLKDLGLMQVSYAQSYSYMNKYLALDRREDKSAFKLAQIVYNDMEVKLSEFTDIIGFLNYHVKANSYRMGINRIVRDSERVSNNYTVTDILTDLTSALRNITKTENIMQSRMSATVDTFTIRKINADFKRLSQTYQYLSKVRLFYQGHRDLRPSSSSMQEFRANSDIVFTLYSDIMPTLSQMTIWDADVVEDVNNVEKICRHISNYYKNDITSPYHKIAFDNISPFLTIVSQCYEFDKIKTFSDCIKLLSDFEQVFPNERIKDALSFINTYIRDFVSIKHTKENIEFIDINIESLLSKLGSVKPDKLRRGGLLFTVGVNTSFFPNLLSVSASENIRNTSFISEKIGFKYKLGAYDFWKTRNPGETYNIGPFKYKKTSAPIEPIISDFYFLLYGSGILYNIVNTGTSNDFEYPVFGTGFGLTLYNSLGINITTGVPIMKDSALKTSFDNPFICVSFDFPFLEYIKRLGEKQRAKSNKKVISNALNESSGR